MSLYDFNSTDQAYDNVNKDLDFVSQGRKYPLKVKNYENPTDSLPSYMPPYNLHTVNQFQNNSNWSSNHVSPFGEYPTNVTSSHMQQSMDILQFIDNQGILVQLLLLSFLGILPRKTKTGENAHRYQKLIFKIHFSFISR